MREGLIGTMVMILLSAVAVGTGLAVAASGVPATEVRTAAAATLAMSQPIGVQIASAISVPLH